MKKRFAAVLLIAVAAVSSLAAVDISLAVGGQGTFGELSIGDSANYNFSVDAELDMDFGRGQGMLIGLLVGMQDIDISVGYAYQTDISSNCDFILGAGATLGLKNPVELNFFVTADFDFNITQNMYIRLGTGFITDFGKLDNEYASNPKFIIPLPSIGFGWDF